ncbi:hypothetical protein [Thermoactinomyces mirandus]|uniref:Uncharacterized protein n=1 Tax=Thermoactinomyces mirandus TaxID=2756294 RepID=A0A7W2AS09_9BACL|nr:hypothetical protein [Thermoactinomyces mirandus]MBA4601956.1 hypothetical protein [Thermoactinomyces mirandus]
MFFTHNIRNVFDEIKQQTGSPYRVFRYRCNSGVCRCQLETGNGEKISIPLSNLVEMEIMKGKHAKRVIAGNSYDIFSDQKRKTV